MRALIAKHAGDDQNATLTLIGVFPGMCRNSKTKQTHTTLRPLPLPLVIAALLTVLITGCASPGPPRPPSLNLLRPVVDLTAERVGNQVVLRWTTSARTTDNLPPKGTLTAVICRAEIPGNSSPSPVTAPATHPPPPSKSARHKPHPTPPPTTCSPILRLAVSSGPGSAIDPLDPLPSSLTQDPVTLLDYRVEILNSAGHSAGPSNPGFAAAGSAPATIEDLHVTTIPSGAMLEWRQSLPSTSTNVELTRINTSLETTHRPTNPTNPVETPAQPESRSSPARKAQKIGPPLRSAGQESPETHLRVPPAEPEQTANDRAGAIDLTARFGPTYRYTAQRVRTIELNGHPLEIRSLDSAPVTLTLRDTFPPATPAGLIAIPGQTATQTSIDLSWQSNSDPDLAGYFVYRHLISDSNHATPARLNPTPLTGPAFSDLSTIPGQRYGYTITAVDTSGNESSPTPEIDETPTSQPPLPSNQNPLP